VAIRTPAAQFVKNVTHAAELFAQLLYLLQIQTTLSYRHLLCALTRWAGTASKINVTKAAIVVTRCLPKRGITAYFLIHPFRNQGKEILVTRSLCPWSLWLWSLCPRSLCHRSLFPMVTLSPSFCPQSLCPTALSVSWLSCRPWKLKTLSPVLKSQPLWRALKTMTHGHMAW
jgi:hypothetical protein